MPSSLARFARASALVRMSAENWQRYLGGERPSPSEYYFRVAPRFEAGHERYRWLNGALFVGAGFDLPPTPRYRIFEVL